jgi:Family of unknown function (DUF6519)
VSFDNSRFTFDPFKDYAGVVAEQGRVQADADWNEWLAEDSRRTQAGMLDIMGHAAYPPTTPYAFQITTPVPSAGQNNTISIGLGRMYVDGLLAENHGPLGSAVWDPALAELSGSPQLPPTQASTIDFSSQPYSPNAIVPQGGGTYLAYLDVWKRPITYIEDPNLVDVAIGIDTAGRVQTAWRVGLIPLPGSGFSVAGSVTSGTFVPNEEVVQATSGASAYLVGIVAGAGPMFVGPITGAADATHIWTGQTSQAVFAPTGGPSVFNPSSTVTGSVTSGVFVGNEQVVQTHTGASANLIGTVTGTSSMIIGPITGTADATDTWVGQTSGAVYTPTAAPVVSVWNCQTPDSAIPWPATSGQLTTDTVQSGPSGPCCLTTGTGYTGVENQFYRVEIHNPGGAGGANATFKWSRENGSVQTTVTGIANGKNSLNKPASVLTVQSLGRDQVLGFSNGNWIEISNQTLDDNCLPGELYKIDSVDVPTMSITLTTLLSGNFPASSLAPAVNQYTRICRWDQAGKIVQSDNSPYSDLDATGPTGLPVGMGGIPVPPAGTVLLLENGITVQFGLSSATGNHLAMDYWTFAARTADGLLHPQLSSAPPRGLYHHYTKLSVVTLGSSPSATNCRTQWNPSGGGDCNCCCTYTVGDGGNYSSITAALAALPPTGGEVCILPGTIYEYVLLKGLKNVVIRGCGSQTHVCSPALQAGSVATSTGSGSSSSGGGAGGTGGAASSSESGLTAVFTVVACQHIEFHSFSVHAADDEIGILLDRSPDIETRPKGGGSGIHPDIIILEKGKGDSDVSIEKLLVTASTLPAIIAVSITRLRIAENRIAMKNVESLWAAVYMSGDEMSFNRNWVGLHEGEDASLLATGDQTTMTGTKKNVASAQQASGAKFLLASGSSAHAPGGIHIAGPSKNVVVLENDIGGGSRNGITLGNFVILDANGADTGKLTGLLVEVEDQCAPGGSSQIPGTTSGPNPTKIGAGGVIQNLHIDRNRIHNMGMCGIGPIGFFDLSKTLEMISIVNLTITENIISRTLMRPVVVPADRLSLGYGAICIPDVQDLIVRDNIITDFGVTSGAEVCGIFVFHGEMIDISRNQIKETRDLSASSASAANSFAGRRGGILVLLATPPLMGDAWTIPSDLAIFRVKPVYAPGMPALRMQENVVRVALGLALEAVGLGPFEIVSNHFSTGGTVNVSSDALRTFDVQGLEASSGTTLADALTVAIVNLGLAIEDVNAGDMFRQIYATRSADLDNGAGLANSSNGAVLFTNNVCQLESWISGVQGFTSVGIASLDHVMFANNQLWLDGPAWPKPTALLDAFIFGLSIHVCTNRFQESQKYPVLYSGFTAGLVNITSQNISTYCLVADALLPGFLVNQHNLQLNSALCTGKRVSGG